MEEENQRCLECNVDLGRPKSNLAKHYFCSIECACYAGVLNLNTGWNEEKLKQLLEGEVEVA